MERAFSAIRDWARMAWWDGSSVGLHLSGLLGLFEAPEAPATSRGERR